jgi:hypothetical protein
MPLLRTKGLSTFGEKVGGYEEWVTRWNGEMENGKKGEKKRRKGKRRKKRKS